MRKARVVHINLFDSPRGEADTAWALMDAMTAGGHDVHIFAHQKNTDDHRVISMAMPQTEWQRQLLTHQRQRGLFDLYSTALFTVLKHPQFEEADIVHLHCTNGGYFSYLLLPFLTAKPTVWTLHEPYAFTGGCLNTLFCDKWRNHCCNDCPQDEEEAAEGLQRGLLLLLKKSIYKLSNFSVVCSSASLARKARESILRRHDIRHIYSGVNTNVFTPCDRTAIRGKLGLPRDKKILLFPANGDLDSYYKGCTYLKEALNRLSEMLPELMLINYGGPAHAALEGINVEQRQISFTDKPEVTPDYYAAADILLAPSPAETFNMAICKAMACGTPAIGLNLGSIPEIIDHGVSGYLVDHSRPDDLAERLSLLLSNVPLRQHMAKAARKKVQDVFNVEHMIMSYAELYDELAQNSQKYWCMFSQERISEQVEKSLTKGWDYVWQDFERAYQGFTCSPAVERAIFTDCFLSCCLEKIKPVTEPEAFLHIIELWNSHRYLPLRGVGLSPSEKKAVLKFSVQLREKLQEYLLGTALPQLADVSGDRQRVLITVWWQLFFDSFAQLNQQPGVSTCEPYGQNIAAAKCSANWAGEFMTASMYHPFVVGHIPLSGRELWNHPGIPVWCKMILSYWLINVPYYHIEEAHRNKLVAYLPDLLQAPIPPMFFFMFANQAIDYLWRISYAGGNNAMILAEFGDFLTKHMNRLHQAITNSPRSLPGRQETGRIRIGYISRLFRNQAVSYYMVNRVIHHDRDQFEVFIFSLNDSHDSLNDLFMQNCDHFLRFSEPFNIEKVARNIVECDLDILIYTDLGMDAATYSLASMQLVPVQCAMVGHGTTTGLSTIQYYISGDFEPAQAEMHYREKLIRLPNLGAAQYPPPCIKGPVPSRKDWKIPDDVVVFVSCANGIKHIPARNALLIEILKKAPNSCIVLKPYHFLNEDQTFANRLTAAAQAAKVSDRLFIIPPLKYVDALLAVSDIQLDTYPYGGWTTNMEALYAGLPIVTQQGELARSRWGAHMLKAVGVLEGIAANEQEYVEWAVRYACDDELRAKVKRVIKMRAETVLFNGEAAQSSFEEALVKIAQDHGLI